MTTDDIFARLGGSLLQDILADTEDVSSLDLAKLELELDAATKEGGSSNPSTPLHQYQQQQQHQQRAMRNPTSASGSAPSAADRVLNHQQSRHIQDGYALAGSRDELSRDLDSSGRENAKQKNKGGINSTTLNTTAADDAWSAALGHFNSSAAQDFLRADSEAKLIKSQKNIAGKGKSVEAMAREIHGSNSDLSGGARDLVEKLLEGEDYNIDEEPTYYATEKKAKERSETSSLNDEILQEPSSLVSLPLEHHRAPTSSTAQTSKSPSTGTTIPPPPHLMGHHHPTPPVIGDPPFMMMTPNGPMPFPPHLMGPPPSHATGLMSQNQLDHDRQQNLDAATQMVEQLLPQSHSQPHRIALPSNNEQRTAVGDKSTSEVNVKGRGWLQSPKFATSEAGHFGSNADVAITSGDISSRSPGVSRDAVSVSGKNKSEDFCAVGGRRDRGISDVEGKNGDNTNKMDVTMRGVQGQQERRSQEPPHAKGGGRNARNNFGQRSAGATSSPQSSIEQRQHIIFNDPMAPPVPALFVASALMASRDLTYVVNSMMRSLQTTDPYNGDYYFSHMHDKRASVSQSMFFHLSGTLTGGSGTILPPPASKEAKEKARENEMKYRSILLERARDWKEEKHALGQVVKSDVKRPRALLATPLMKFGDGESNAANERDDTLRRHLWRARGLVDKGFRALLELHELQRAYQATAGDDDNSNVQRAEIIMDIDDNIKALEESLGISKLKISESDATCPIVAVEADILGSTLSLTKGQEMLARSMERGVLPHNSAAAALPVTLSILFRQARPSKMAESSVMKEDRLLRCLTQIIRLLNPCLTASTLLSCLDSVIETSKQSGVSLRRVLGVTSRAEVMHALLARGSEVMLGITADEAGTSNRVREKWTSKEEEFLQRLASE